MKKIIAKILLLSFVFGVMWLDWAPQIGAPHGIITTALALYSLLMWAITALEE